jgi:carbon monoxide dehydrogenase subunit G
MTLTKTIAAPLERVFAAMSDFAGAPARIPEIVRVEMLTAGPVGVGTKFQETRKMFGKEATETFEVTAFEPNRRYVLGTQSNGMIVTTDMRFASEGPGTRVDIAIAAVPQKFIAKIMAFVMGGMMRRIMTKCIMGDLAAIERTLGTPTG